ncbi:MAG: hypothetical protein Q9216_003825 [Gyalolechia sp. 2 TL-2023]
MPGGRALFETDHGSTSSESSKAGKAKANDPPAGEDPTVSKMVDWSLGLQLGWKDDNIISQAFSTVWPNLRSLNQSLSFIDMSPLFVDIEIKKTNPGRNPEVQLAIWKCAALKKLREMGWDTSMPMPGIVIEGHTWLYYVFVEIEKDLIMIGPFTMGSTSDLVGIWTLVYRLNLLMEWGTTTYKRWFDDNIVAWARERISQEQAELEDRARGLAVSDTAS